MEPERGPERLGTAVSDCLHLLPRSKGNRSHPGPPSPLCSHPSHFWVSCLASALSLPYLRLSLWPMLTSGCMSGCLLFPDPSLLPPPAAR